MDKTKSRIIIQNRVDIIQMIANERRSENERRSANERRTIIHSEENANKINNTQQTNVVIHTDITKVIKKLIYFKT